MPGVRAHLHVWWPVVSRPRGSAPSRARSLVWFVVDVQDTFGAPASTVIRAAAAAAGAGLGLGIVNLVRARWWRKVVAVVASSRCSPRVASMINRDVAYFPRLGDALGLTGVGVAARWAARTAPSACVTGGRPRACPRRARSGRPTSPGRLALARPDRLGVRAARRADGESAEASGRHRLLRASRGALRRVHRGRPAATIDAIAGHHGVAPVVVVPDQLGALHDNPMCVNSRMGDVARYVTDDVREWILRHLPVSRTEASGPSPGSRRAAPARCSSAEYPPIFGSYLAISPELGHIDGSVARTVREAFRGSGGASRRPSRSRS